MPTYTQTDRPLAITTPLGKDVLLLTAVRGNEAISQLFSLQVDLLAEAQREIRFDRILGQNVTVEIQLPSQEKRYFNGIIKRFSQDARDDTFLHFHAELVPKFWLWTKKVRSRIFQHLTVPDILRKVLLGLDVTYEFSGIYYERDYCVQYRESDFDFASRLMEEEGIYYFFKHADGSHQLVVTDTANPVVSGQANIIYEEVSHGVVPDMRITSWEKTQELRSGEYTLWDHCFELPGKHLEASQKIIDSVTAGKVTHKLNVGGNDQLEIYDFPGGYAQRFDGIDRAGAPRPQDLKRIYEDRDRTVKVRMEQEAVASLDIRGASDCGHFAAGHKFTLQRHFDANGPYVLTGIEHEAHLSGYRSGEPPEFSYENHFTCIPAALRYRPQRVTPKPVIAGIQTANVVGPEGEEIFCDKYGRVKVQFHWDREGKKDANSSCWLRVAQVWAGKGWGAFFWPRIGHEVVVSFEEGDPDQPLITGSVYNAENMPWYALPMNKELAGFKSASVRGANHENFNGIVFDDLKDHEHLSLHSERHMSFNTEYDKSFHAGRHKGERVAGASVFTVGHLPGGGSGGGPDCIPPVSGTLPGSGCGGGGGATDPPWPKPYPQGVLGLNASMVFGENMQTAVGINHQLTVGSNFSIVVNPAGLMQGLGPKLPELPFFTEVLSSGIGGNMQLTIGTNCAVIYGRNIEVDAGMPKLELHAGTPEEDAVSYALVGGMGAVVFAYILLYGLFDGDAERANFTIAFQIIMDILLSVMMKLEMEKHQADAELEKIRQKLFDDKRAIEWDQREIVGEWDGSEISVSPTAQAAFAAGAVILGAAVLPLVLVAKHEKDAESS